MGAQVRADVIAFLYMTAATQALSAIQEDIVASGGKTAPLLAKYVVERLLYVGMSLNDSH